MAIDIRNALGLIDTDLKNTSDLYDQDPSKAIYSNILSNFKSFLDENKKRFNDTEIRQLDQTYQKVKQAIEQAESGSKINNQQIAKAIEALSAVNKNKDDQFMKNMQELIKLNNQQNLTNLVRQSQMSILESLGGKDTIEKLKNGGKLNAADQAKIFSSADQATSSENLSKAIIKGLSVSEEARTSALVKFEDAIKAGNKTTASALSDVLIELKADGKINDKNYKLAVQQIDLLKDQKELQIAANKVLKSQNEYLAENKSALLSIQKSQKSALGKDGLISALTDKDVLKNLGKSIGGVAGKFSGGLLGGTLTKALGPIGMLVPILAPFAKWAGSKIIAGQINDVGGKDSGIDANSDSADDLVSTLYGKDNERKLNEKLAGTYQGTEKGKQYAAAAAALAPAKPTAGSAGGGGTGRASTEEIKPSKGGGRAAPENIQQIINSAADKVGVDRTIMTNIARAESSFNPRAGAATSSAKGLYQFINDTWKKMVSTYGREYGLTYGGVFDPYQNALAGALYIRDNSKILKRGNVPVNSATIYMAHFLGPGGAVKFYQGYAKNPTAPAYNFVSPKVASSNRSIFFDKSGNHRSAAQVYAILAKKAGDSGIVSEAMGKNKVAPKSGDTGGGGGIAPADLAPAPAPSGGGSGGGSSTPTATPSSTSALASPAPKSSSAPASSTPAATATSTPATPTTGVSTDAAIKAVDSATKKDDKKKKKSSGGLLGRLLGLEEPKKKPPPPPKKLPPGTVLVDSKGRVVQPKKPPKKQSLLDKLFGKEKQPPKPPPPKHPPGTVLVDSKGRVVQPKKPKKQSLLDELLFGKKKQPPPPKHPPGTVLVDSKGRIVQPKPPKKPPKYKSGDEPLITSLIRPLTGKPKEELTEEQKKKAAEDAAKKKQTQRTNPITGGLKSLFKKSSGAGPDKSAEQPTQNIVNNNTSIVNNNNNSAFDTPTLNYNYYN